MPTYNGWNIITIPAYPPAPQSIEFTQNDAVAISQSPFSGQQQVQIWGGSWMEASVVMPPMTFVNAQAWVAFLRALQGVGNVFQFSAAFMAAYPADLGSRYWRLKQNTRKWSISQARLYGLQFEIREAI